jgi:hypothetical protein
LPTAAQMIGNWDILYQSLATKIQKSFTNDITVDYHIGKGCAYQVDLLKQTVPGQSPE